MYSSLKLYSLSVLCFVGAVNAWMPTVGRIARPTTLLQSSQSTKDGVEVDNPCWQDIWNYDCAMSNIYSATFIAGDWIKSMPCASGLVDCETPEELKIPPPAGHGVEDIDVMDFLNLKRAAPLNKAP